MNIVSSSPSVWNETTRNRHMRITSVEIKHTTDQFIRKVKERKPFLAAIFSRTFGTERSLAKIQSALDSVSKLFFFSILWDLLNEKGVKKKKKKGNCYFSQTMYVLWYVSFFLNVTTTFIAAIKIIYLKKSYII